LCNNIPDPSPPTYTINNGVDGNVSLRVHIYSFDITNGLLGSKPTPFAYVTIDGNEYRTSAISDTDQGAIDWITTAFLDGSSGGAGTGTIDLVVEFRSLTGIDAYASTGVDFNSNTNTITLTYDFTTNQVSGTAITTGIYNSPTDLLTVTGSQGTINMYFEVLSVGGCDTGNSATDSCPGDTPASVVTRNAYCQAQNTQFTICIEETSEGSNSGNCRDTELIAQLAALSFSEEIDFAVSDCSNSCDNGGLQYDVTMYSPNNAVQVKKSALLTAAEATNSISGFNVLSSPAVQTVASFGIFVATLLCLALF